MLEILAIASIILLTILIILAIILLLKTSKMYSPMQAMKLDSIEKGQDRTERIIHEEISTIRDEINKSGRDQRQELNEAIKLLSDSLIKRMLDASGMQKVQLDDFSNKLNYFAETSGLRLDGVREETAAGAKLLREEVIITLKSLSETITKTMVEMSNFQKGQLEVFSNQLASFEKSSIERLDGVRIESSRGAKQLREEVIATLNGITETTTKTMGELANVQKSQLENLSLSLGGLSESIEKKLEFVRSTVETKLQAMQTDNAKQLDQMRQTVDEKLQGTLEKRLGESFKQVSDRLELVHKGLGEMQTLATGVGDLKKVLTNVKTRGTWGEVQLGTLLEQVLIPDQYSTNVATKDGNERVEYVINLPNQGETKDEIVWLPVDAKFPIEDYQRLIDAQDAGDISAAEIASKQIESSIKSCARDISKKYLNPPKTTDFGILFLPIEGLFAEVVRRAGLIDAIQREYRVVIAGPTTLWSLLTSLQMGFRTLAIQKRSSEVWNLLAAVKTEWTKYGEVLDAVHKKIHQASEAIEKAQVRSRAVGRKLRDVQALPANENTALLPQSARDSLLFINDEPNEEQNDAADI